MMFVAETVTRAAPWPGEFDPVGVERAMGWRLDRGAPHPNPLPKGEGMEARPQFALRAERRFGSTEGARFISPRAKPRVADRAMPAHQKPQRGVTKNAGCRTSRRTWPRAARFASPRWGERRCLCGTVTRAAPWPDESDPVGVEEGDVGAAFRQQPKVQDSSSPRAQAPGIRRREVTRQSPNGA